MREEHTLKFCFKKRPSQSAIEFLVVFSVLLTFFLVIADIGLFFKQIYTVQSVADEALARLVSYGACSDSDSVIPLLRRTVGDYYHGWKSVDFSYTGTSVTGTYISGDSRRRFIFNVKCREAGSVVPSSLIFSYRYYGLFMFMRGKYITSGVTSNTAFY